MRDNSHAEILVVDDDAMSRRVLAQLLSAAGYNCRASAFAFAAGFRHARSKRRRGAQAPSLGRGSDGRPNPSYHADGTWQRPKRGLLSAGRCGRFFDEACQCVGVEGANRDPTSASLYAATTGATKR